MSTISIAVAPFGIRLGYFVEHCAETAQERLPLLSRQAAKPWLNPINRRARHQYIKQ